MATSYNGIVLQGNPRLEEHIASAAFTPGHLVEIHNSSGNLRARKHASAGQAAEYSVALENPLAGSSATDVEANTIDDAYAANDRARIGYFKKGEEAFVYIRAGENLSIGDKLISAGDGTLMAQVGADSSGNDDTPIAVAMEALDLSATGASNTRLRVRFI